jgi:hypothetical protein
MRAEFEPSTTADLRFPSDCRNDLYKSRSSSRFINRLAFGIFGLNEMEESRLIFPAEFEEVDNGPLDATATICADC